MDDLIRIPSRLAELWKDFFGLYTQYVGYLTPEMVRTILQIKRSLDNSPDGQFADMNLSRVQLYRKVKSITGSSPVELLRTARLNRGYQLLLTTDKTVSEVAYSVGFTAPSYFAKCFKEEFGHNPTEIKR